MNRQIPFALKTARLPGMSFIEIMIVIVIMAAIAALAGPALFNQFGGAKVNQARIQMETFVNTLDLYRIDNTWFPSSEQGLDALLKKTDLRGDIRSLERTVHQRE